MKKILRYIRKRMHRDILDRLDSMDMDIREKMNEQLKSLNDSSHLLWAEAGQSISQSVHQSVSQCLSAYKKEDLFAAAGVNPVPFSELAVDSANPYAHGNYYSPIPSPEKIAEFDFSRKLPDSLPGINLRTDEQFALLEQLLQYYADIPFTFEQTERYRYYYNNFWYNCGDGIFLNLMLRYLKPKRLIEVGSGFSSAVTLDTNQYFLDNKMECTFIEPFPERLKLLLRPNDNIQLHKKYLQDIPLSVFTQLQPGDVLFIDTSHVSKFQSDVNYLIHEILPILNSGVYIHIHDIDYPFEYPEHWMKEGRGYTESYILRAFLEFNDVFQIELFEGYLMRMFGEKMLQMFPLLRNGWGLAFWMSKVK